MKKVIAVALLSTVFAAPAFAEQYYAGGQLSSNSSSGSYSSNGFGAFVGYTLDDKWAVEGSYNLFGKKSSGAYSSEFSALSVHGVYSHVINDKVNLLGKIGLTSTTFKYTAPSYNIPGFGTIGGGSSSTSKSGLAYGIGASYAMDAKLSIRGGYDIYNVDGGNLNSLYVGAAYKF